MGDGAADAAREQCPADDGAAGVRSQHRALEEAVLSLQGRERPAQEQGSRAHPQESHLFQSAAPAVARSLGFLLLALCMLEDRFVFRSEVDGGGKAAASLRTPWAGKDNGLAISGRTWSSLPLGLGDVVSAGPGWSNGRV